MGWAFWRKQAADQAPAEEQKRNYSISDPYAASLLGFPALEGAPAVSENTALTLSAFFRGVSLIAGSVASLPLRTLIENESGLTVRSSSFLDNPGGRDNKYTPAEFKSLLVTHLLLHGNAYAQHLFDGAGRVVGLNLIHPLAVTPEWDQTVPGGKIFKVSTEDGDTLEFNRSTMTQIMGLSLDGLRGVSVIEKARISLGGSMAGDRQASKQFTNGASIVGYVSPKSAEGDLENEEDIATVKRTVNSAFTGPENAGGVAVLSQALEFHPLTLAPKDMQFIESRTFSVDEVARWLGIPPHMLGLVEKSTSWGEGIAELSRGFARYTLTALTNPIEERLSLLLPNTKTAKFDFTQFVEPSPEDKIALILTEVNGGLLTPNEGRALLDLPPIEGQDELRLPAGMGPASKVLEEEEEVSDDEQPDEA